MKKGDLCLVTGASGYLASWIAKDLLEQGYRVRGTVRSLDDAPRVAALQQLLPGIELVAADLRDEAGWAPALADCQWVFHVASPQAVPSERDRTGGALSGTMHLMRAALAEPTVRKIVVTSSEAAVAYGHPASKRVINEHDWTQLDVIAKSADYFRSKTLAERLAWKLAGDTEANPRRIPVATVNPSLILGPSLVPWSRFSLGLLSTIAQGKMPLMVDMTMRVVDVRDCARMHIAVMADPLADGRRHLSMATTTSFAGLARIIAARFGEQGFKPAIRMAPAWLVRVLGWLSGEIRSIQTHIGTQLHYETLSPHIYRYQHRDIEAIVEDSMHSMLAHGWLTPRSAGPARKTA